METDQVVEKVTGLLDPLAADQGAILDAVDFNANTQPPTLVLTVARADGTESLKSDQVANLTRSFSKALDDNDPIDGEYTLEVSTPGAESALTTERQWARAVGRTVRIKRSNGHTVEGTLTKVGVDSVVLHVNNGNDEIPFAEIKSARGVAELPKEA